MRAAVSKACAVLDVTSSVEGLDRAVCPDGDEIPGSEKGSFARIRCHRFCSLREYLAPMIARPVRWDFSASFGFSRAPPQPISLSKAGRVFLGSR